jgi:Uma2 family endonuclease
MVSASHRPRKTVRDYLDLPERVRAELIGGELYVTPSPTSGHQEAAGRLYARLLAWLPGDGARVFIAPLDVYLPSGDVVQPDVVFVAAANRGIVEAWVRGVPDLLVEVASPANAERDRIVKRDLYAQNGVPEYWIVDPDAGAIEVLRLDRGAYHPAGYFERGSVLVSTSLPGLGLSIDDVLAPARG